MRRQAFIAVGVVMALVVPASTLTVTAQLPLSPLGGSGQTVTPVFEGWYQNPDGTYSISFGYFNRNFEEVVEIPIGTYLEQEDYERLVAEREATGVTEK